LSCVAINTPLQNIRSDEYPLNGGVECTAVGYEKIVTAELLVYSVYRMYLVDVLDSLRIKCNVEQAGAKLAVIGYCVMK